MDNDLYSKIVEFSSSNDETMEEARAFLINMFDENPWQCMIELFDIFNNSNDDNHRSLSLIMINYIIKIHLEAVFPNLPNISENFGFSIINPNNQKFYRLHSDIVYKIALYNDDLWEDFPTYLTLFQTQPNLEIFCIDLYINCYSNKIIFSKYRQIFNELDNTITFVGLQHKNIDTKIYSIRHIIKNISKSKNDAVFQHYEEQFNQILQITKESADNMDAQQFETLWSIFYILPPKYLHELFDISFGLLETRKFPPNCQMKLLNIILTDYMKINPMYLEEIITLYFTAQASVEDIDFMNQIFINLSRVDFAQSYELFKTNLLSLLESTNEYQQYIGLFMINDFINTYMFYINSEISTIIHCTLQIEPFTIENFKLISNYLVDYLNFNKISYKDAENIYCGILELFVNSTSTDFLYQAYKISQKMGPNPIYFDGFIESFDKVQFDSLPIYFSLLLNLHSVENDMSDQKYEPFFEFLTQNFELGGKKLDEL